MVQNWLKLVEITKEEYDNLLRRSEFLDYLFAAGIDNTEAYAYATELANKDGFFDNKESI